MADLLDINVWVALSVEEHPHHNQARTYWRNKANRELRFCRVTGMGLVRVLSNPHALTTRPLGLADAWNIFSAWKARPEVTFLDEPDGIDGLLENWCRGGLFTAKNWTDAYLAAFAIAGGLRLVTFDGGFRKFPDLDLLVLTD